MTFQIREVSSNRDYKLFVDFVFKHYKKDKFWVPPIKSDELFSMKKDKNPAFEFCEAKYWLAEENGKVIGRIGAIINHAYNKKVDDLYGRINRVEFIDNADLSKALFGIAESWLRDKGMKKVHGPLGYTNIDQQGLLIEGFNSIPSIASVHNQAFYQNHFDNLGYKKENDWLEFQLTVGEEATKKASRGAALIKRRYGFESLSFTNTKDLKEYGHTVFEILNDAFKVLPYTVPFTDKMIEASSKKYFSILNPKYVKIIKKGDEVIAFFVGLPTLSKAMQKANGKIIGMSINHLRL